ncbi:MAG: hypothetical protein OXU51_00740 [Candidatus Poribacteria bacterium]|nr:hypothetical protein [Candidatus Poribacteria bacterium]
MNVIEMADAEIYEHSIKVLTEHFGLPGTTRFLQICQPSKDEIIRTGQQLTILEMEEIREKVYKSYAAKSLKSKKERNRKMTKHSNIAFYKLGIKAISDALGPIGMARFIRIRKPNLVSYTEERHKWLDKLDKDTILTGIQQIQQEYLVVQTKDEK